MKSHINREFIREVEKVFSTAYPYLKIEFPKDAPRWLQSWEEGIDAGRWEGQALDFLREDVRLSDGMTVGDLEGRLRETLGVPAVILRRSGNFWIETRMTRNWTLKDQNDHGRELGGRIS